MDLQKKINVILAVFLGISLLWVVFVIYPLFQHIKKYSKDLFLIREDLASVKAKTQQTSVLKEKIQMLEPDLEKIQKLFVDPEIPIDFLQFLEKTAKDCDVSIDISLLPKSEKETVPFPSLNFQLGLVGSFPNCLKFFGKLETAPYLIEIREVRVKRLAEDQLRLEEYKEPSLRAVEFNLSIKTFTR